MKKYIYLSAVAVMALASCSTMDEETTSSKVGTEPISLSSKVLGVSTRSASSTILQATQIAANNSVGIYIYDQGKTAVTTAGYGYENYQYTPDGKGALTLTNNQTAPCYSTSGSVDIYGYAPRFSSINTGFTTVQPFAVKDDQSSDADYIASDLIYGTLKDQKVSTDARNIVFVHKLSKVNITLSADGTYGFLASDLSGATVKLRNVVKGGIIQLADGTFTTPNNAAKSDVTVFNVAASNTATSVSGSAVIVPQTFTNDATTSLIEITLSSGKVYQYIPDTDISFAAGTQYNFTITMKNTGITVSSTITPWSTSTDTTGDAVKQEPQD
jgi:hypothetical protein